MKCVVFCENNLARFAQPAADELTRELSGTDAEVIEFPCLDRCALCKVRPHAWVNQKAYVDAPSCAELVEQIRALITEDE